MELFALTRAIGKTDETRAVNLLLQLQPLGSVENALWLDEKIFWHLKHGECLIASRLFDTLRYKMRTDDAVWSYVKEHLNRLTSHWSLCARQLSLDRQVITSPLRIYLHSELNEFKKFFTHLWPNAEIENESIFLGEMLQIEKHNDSEIIIINKLQKGQPHQIINFSNPKNNQIYIPKYVLSFYNRKNHTQLLTNLLLGFDATSPSSSSTTAKKIGSVCSLNTQKDNNLVNTLKKNSNAIVDLTHELHQLTNDERVERLRSFSILVVDLTDDIEQLLELVLNCLIANMSMKIIVVANQETTEMVLTTHFQTENIVCIPENRVVQQLVNVIDGKSNNNKKSVSLLTNQGEWFYSKYYDVLKMAIVTKENEEETKGKEDDIGESSMFSLKQSPVVSALKFPDHPMCDPEELQITVTARNHNQTPTQETRTLTLVTGLFSIRARERRASPDSTNVSCKTPEEYIKLAKPLLAWPINMIIFTEPYLVSSIERERRQSGLIDRTLIVPILIEQSSYFRHFQTILKLFETNRQPFGFSPTKDTAYYVWSQATKYHCLEQSIRANPFGSNRFYWIDFGIHHVATPPKSVPVFLDELQRAELLRCTLLRRLTLKETMDRAQFFGRLQQAVGGGLIGGPVADVQWLITEFESVFVDALYHYQRPVLDEGILGVIVMQNYHRFFPIYSGHKEMLETRKFRTSMVVVHQEFLQKNWMKVIQMDSELQELNSDVSSSASSFFESEKVAYIRRKQWLLESLTHVLLDNTISPLQKETLLGKQQQTIECLRSVEKDWPKDLFSTLSIQIENIKNKK